MKRKQFIWAGALSLLVAALTGRASSLVDSHGNAIPATIAQLELPVSYVILSPVSRWLDTITLLSVPQTVWLFAALAVIVLALKARSVKRTLLYLLGTVVSVAVVLAAAIALPRPAARLEAKDANVVRVDFHSHTNASKDANQRFTAEDNRRWHIAGGFDVAYITDHVRFTGASEAMRKNPARSGDSLVILSGVEGRYHKIFSTILLGLSAKDSAAIDSKGHLLPNQIDPVSIVAIPNRNLDSIFPDSLPHFSALELVDAAPRGLGQLDKEESRLRSVATQHNLLLVSASNNHGWGNTVAAWNLMTIPGWRDRTPDSLGMLIESALRQRNPDAVVIVKRLRPTVHGAMLPLTLPVAAYQVIASLTLAERGVWLVWIWLFAVIVSLRRKSIRARA